MWGTLTKWPGVPQCRAMATHTSKRPPLPAPPAPPPPPASKETKTKAQRHQQQRGPGAALIVAGTGKIDDDVDASELMFHAIPRGIELVRWVFNSQEMDEAKDVKRDSFQAILAGLLRRMNKIDPNLVVYTESKRTQAESQDYLKSKWALGGAKGMSAVAFSIAHRRYDVLRLLLEKGASPLKIGRVDFDPMLVAAYTRDRYPMALLLEKGASINAIAKGVDGHETCPLMVALEDQNGSLVSWLLSRGADPDIRLERPLLGIIFIFIIIFIFFMFKRFYFILFYQSQMSISRRCDPYWQNHRRT